MIALSDFHAGSHLKKGGLLRTNTKKKFFARLIDDIIFHSRCKNNIISQEINLEASLLD